MTSTKGVLATVVALLALASPATAQDFSWTGRLGAGQAIEIKGINGEIHAVAATGDQIRVTADKEGRRSDPEDVRIEVVEHDGGVTICAVYPTPSGREPNECRPGSRGRMNNERNDVNVDFRVEVPAGVRFIGRNVNGDVAAESLRGDVEARTVNGDVRVTTDGTAVASSVNGSLDIAMGSADWTEDVEFETVNGGIVLRIAGDLNADVAISTVNGDIETDFPVTVQGRWGSRRVRGTVGSGGRELSLSTVNGSIELRRR